MIPHTGIAEFVGGLGLFIFAMSLLESVLRQFSARSVRQFLQAQAKAPWRSVLVGTAATAIVQSSSLVGLIVLALVGASVLPLQSALGVIFGANLGTTVTGWLVATLGFKLDFAELAYWLVGLGALGAIALRGGWRTTGSVLTAVGLLLIGLALMKSGVGGLADTVDIEALAALAPWQFLLFGVVAAAVLQSSSATISIVLTGISVGLLDVADAAAVAVGADLGTTTTVMIGATFGAATKRRAAAAHFLFNLTTTVVAFALLAPLLAIVRAIGIEDPLYTLVAFHTLFNLLGVLIFLPILRPLAGWLERRFPDVKRQQSRFIEATVADVPAIAVTALAKETGRLIARVLRQMHRAFGLRVAPTMPHLDEDQTTEQWASRVSFADMYRQNKQLEGEILAFSMLIHRAPDETEQNARLSQLLNAARSAIGAAKAIADIQHDLDDLEQAPETMLNAWYRHFKQAFGTSIETLAPIVGERVAPLAVRDFSELHRDLTELHEDINQRIYADVKAGKLDEAQISTLLNVNRELLQANVALLKALQDFFLESEQASTLAETYEGAG